MLSWLSFLGFSCFVLCIIFIVRIQKKKRHGEILLCEKQKLYNWYKPQYRNIVFKYAQWGHYVIYYNWKLRSGIVLFLNKIFPQKVLSVWYKIKGTVLIKHVKVVKNDTWWKHNLSAILIDTTIMPINNMVRKIIHFKTNAFFLIS